MPCRVDASIIEEEWVEIRREREKRECMEDKGKEKVAGKNVDLAFADWVETADELTHKMDVIREEILAGKKPAKAALDTMNKLTTKLIVTWDANPRKRGLKSAHEKLLRQRDAIVAHNMGADGSPMSAITRDQTVHRGEDIERIIDELESRDPAVGTADWERLAAAKAADITKPLIPQLGFDPDDV